MKNIREVITGMEDDVNYSFRLVYLDCMSDEEKNALIEETDFKINKNAVDIDGEPCWKLIDTQEANYSNIEDDEFTVGDYNSIISRLENYWKDYGIIFENEFTQEQIAQFKFI